MQAARGVGMRPTFCRGNPQDVEPGKRDGSPVRCTPFEPVVATRQRRRGKVLAIAHC
jgi:hypothetical protein